jgi:hypothetical protein
MKASFIQIAFLAIAGGLAAAQIPASADEDQKADDRWHVDLTPYVWAPTITGSVQYDRPSIRSGILPGGAVLPGGPVFVPPPTSGTLNLNVGPNSYFSKLNNAAMFTLSARRGTGLLFTDLIYLNLSSGKNTITSFTGPFGNVNLQASSGTQTRLTGTIWTVAGGYVLAQSKVGTLYGFGGWRYAGVTSKLDWQFAGPFGILDRAGHAERSVSLNDAIAGIRGQVRLGGHWYIPYYVDVGAGNSNSTWQGIGGIAYGNVALVFRTMQYNMTGENVFPNIRFGGVALGGTFRF